MCNYSSKHKNTWTQIQCTNCCLQPCQKPCCLVLNPSLTTNGQQPWKSIVTAEDDRTQPVQLLLGRSEMVSTGMTKPILLNSRKLLQSLFLAMLCSFSWMLVSGLVIQLSYRCVFHKCTVFKRTLFKTRH